METNTDIKKHLEITEYRDEGDTSTEKFLQCKTCNRSFYPKVLERHAVICENVANRKRKVFDSSRQRAEGTAIATLNTLKKPESPKKQPNKDIIVNPRVVRTCSSIIKDGGPKSSPPATCDSSNSDHTQCPYCQRSFNKLAAERHIKFCQDQAACKPRKEKLSDETKPPARARYKPPALVKKANPAAAPTVPLASSRLPQRSGLGQPAGIPSSKVSYAASTRTNSPGLTSPASGTGNNSKMINSGNRAVRSTRPRISLDRKKTDSSMSRDEVDQNGLGNGGMKSKFCHGCGSKYPVETANFCCECGIKRMFI